MTPFVVHIFVLHARARLEKPCLIQRSREKIARHLPLLSSPQVKNRHPPYSFVLPKDDLASTILGKSTSPSSFILSKDDFRPLRRRFGIDNPEKINIHLHQPLIPALELPRVHEVDGGEKSVTVEVEEEKRVFVIDPFVPGKDPFRILLETNKKKSEWRKDGGQQVIYGGQQVIFVSVDAILFEHMLGVRCFVARAHALPTPPSLLSLSPLSPRNESLQPPSPLPLCSHLLSVLVPVSLSPFPFPLSLPLPYSSLSLLLPACRTVSSPLASQNHQQSLSQRAMGSNAEEPAKLLLPYLQRVDDLQKHEPLVAYYCNPFVPCKIAS
ncbi:hypothetical protein ACLOJK_016835 [Asimina triloba]